MGYRSLFDLLRDYWRHGISFLWHGILITVRACTLLFTLFISAASHAILSEAERLSRFRRDFTLNGFTYILLANAPEYMIASATLRAAQGKCPAAAADIALDFAECRGIIAAISPPAPQPLPRAARELSSSRLYAFGNMNARALRRSVAAAAPLIWRDEAADIAGDDAFDKPLDALAKRLCLIFNCCAAAASA